MDKIFTLLKSLRGEMKKSRFKIWLRAFLFLQFSLLFSFYFFRDIGRGYFSWEWVAHYFRRIHSHWLPAQSDCPHESGDGNSGGHIFT